MKFDINIYMSPTDIDGPQSNGENQKAGELLKICQSINRKTKESGSTDKTIDYDNASEKQKRNLDILSTALAINDVEIRDNGQYVLNTAYGDPVWDKVDGDDGIHVRLKQVSAMKPVAFPNIQFVRRSSGWLGTHEQEPTVLQEYVWNDTEGYQPVDNSIKNDVHIDAANNKYQGFGGIFVHDGMDFSTGDRTTRENLIEKSLVDPIEIGKANEKFKIPRFHFFFDKERLFCFDSFVRIHNLWKYSRNASDSLETAFHSPRKLGGLYSNCRPGGKSSFSGTYYYETYESDKLTSLHPTPSDGTTIVIDVSDQYMPIILAVPALLTLPLGRLFIKPGNKEPSTTKSDDQGGSGGGVAGYESFDYSMKIEDVTPSQGSYVSSFDDQTVGVITSEKDKKAPTSAYYYGTDVIVATNFRETQDTKKSELEKRKYRVEITYITDQGNANITKQDAPVSGLTYDERNDYVMKMSDVVNSDYYPLAPGRYIVMMYDQEDLNKFSGLAFDILTPKTTLRLTDATDMKSEANKPLAASNLGRITEYDISKYSRYQVGTHLSALALYDLNVANKLQNGDVSQSWDIKLYKASDKDFSKVLWKKEGITFDKPLQQDVAPGAQDLMKDDKNWLSLDSGDYALKASGVTKYGSGDNAMSFTSEDIAVFSIINKLKLVDNTQQVAEGVEVTSGFFQPIYSENKNIAGPLTGLSEDLYFNASTYYTEDVPYTKIVLSFSDKQEHKYKKVLVDIATGQKVSLGSEDAFDNELGGYVLDMKLSSGDEIHPGTYKLTCYDEVQRELFDDVILNLIGKATIAISFSGNTTVNDNAIGSSATAISVTITYASVLTSPVEIAGYVEMLDKGGNRISIIDLFENVGGTGTVENTDKGVTLTKTSITPNTPMSFSLTTNNLPSNVETIRGYVYDVANDNINKIRDYGIINEGFGGGGSGESGSSTMYANRKSSKKKS